MSATFGEVLKEWRGRRRMSQLDLALSADVSQRHLAFLETGRSKPSRAMALQLAEALMAPLPARNQILAAAGFAPVYEARSLDAAQLAQVREAVEWTLERHEPYPGISVDRHWRLLLMNRPAQAIFAALDLAIGDSMLEALLEQPQLRDAIENWDEMAPHMVARLRTESAHYGGDPVLDAAAARLGAGLETADDTTIGSLAAVPARFRAGDQVLSFFSTIAQFGASDDIAVAEMRIELFFPAEDDTRRTMFRQFAA